MHKVLSSVERDREILKESTWDAASLAEAICARLPRAFHDTIHIDVLGRDVPNILKVVMADKSEFWITVEQRQ